MNPQTHIEHIRKQYSGMQDMPRQSLASSVKTLADDLYAKDAHFIFELIQNAEDNEYNHGVNPRLRFEVRMLDIGDWAGPVLIIRNNEIGFQPQHVEAICKVGQSTKKKAQGYIGEKGIGFKSVFRVTDSPFIFSNGYRFCLPEQDVATGLGYIVPTWVEQLPEGMDDAWTTSIFLPLRGKNYSHEKVINDLLEIAPETLLFLQRLTALEIVVDLPEEWHEIIVEKHTELTPGHSRLVNLTHQELTEDEESVSLDTRLYWLTEVEYSKPPEIEHEKRVGIERRVVSVAIPLNPAEQQDRLFAYLPVWEETGIPFLINADFLLVSSREGIREDEEWNQWLRDCVVDAYVKAFLNLVNEPGLDVETRCAAYTSIPLESHRSFLDPIVSKIHDQLKQRACILTSQNGGPVLPVQARLCPAALREVLGNADGLPRPLQADLNLVHPSIAAHSKQLKSIGVTSILLTEILEYLQDAEWLSYQDQAWFVPLYRYLQSQKFERDAFVGLSIVPVTGTDGADPRLSCDREQPIYFDISDDDIHDLSMLPATLPERVAVVRLDVHLWESLESEKDREKLQKWMTDYLRVYNFSVENYCVDIVAMLGANHADFSSQQLLEITRFLIDHAGSNLVWEDLPIVLANGRRNRLGNVRKETSDNVVIPSAADPETGWQHIWATAEDRRHFAALADEYADFEAQWFAALGIRHYPKFKLDVLQGYHTSSSNSDAAVRLYKTCRQRSSKNRWHEIRIENPVVPSMLQNKNSQFVVSEALSHALLALLHSFKINNSYQGVSDLTLLKYGLRTKGTYYYYGQKEEYVNSDIFNALDTLAWLPSTRGPVKPSQAFIAMRGIKEILGVSVPYVMGDLPEFVVDLFNVRTEVTTNILLDLLRDSSVRQSSDRVQAERIYTTLASRFHSLQDNFADECLILIGDRLDGARWVKRGDCVWEDASDVLGDEFAYLSREYPQLQSFFVESLGVKLKVDAEAFANRWLSLQDSPPDDSAEQRARVERICREVRTITQQQNSTPPRWWAEFVNKARIYTVSGVFVAPAETVLADDGELHKIFAADLDYAWRPGRDSFADWSPLFAALGVSLLSESVSEELATTVDYAFLDHNHYLTESAIKMIAAWMREKRKHDYERRIEDGRFNQLLSLREARANTEIQVLFVLHLPTINAERTLEYPLYWDTENNVLLYNDRPNKAQLAKALARGLIPGRTDKDLAHWIELVLEARDTERLKDEQWSVPQEITALFKVRTTPSEADRPATADESGISPTMPSNDASSGSGPETPEVSDRPPVKDTVQETTQEPILGPAAGPAPDNKRASHNKNGGPNQRFDELGDENRRNGANQIDTEAATPFKNEHSASTDNDSTQINYTDALTEAFNRDGVTELATEDDRLPIPPGGGKVNNPILRGSRIADSHRQNRAYEPASEGRRRTTERALLEPPSEGVRIALLDWYQGRCQICGETWPKRNGQPFFAAAYLVERRQARWLDDPANALCLCAKHFAQWRHAAVEAPLDIVEQVESLRLVAEGGDGDLSIWFTLLEADTAIKYDERHFLALRELVNLMKEENV